jgi:GT2 family glycosyltransferase
VSIVIHSRGIYADIDGKSRCYLLEAVTSIVTLSTYSHIELVVVLDSVADPGVIDSLHEIAGSRLRIVPWTEPFNFSDKINRGVIAASGEFVLLLNDDVEIISPDWIESLLALGQRPGAGMVGAMLYYEDGTIQHAGHAYYEGDASHIGLDVARGEAGPLGGFRVEREVSGVTAACALMPAKVFRQVGGLSGLLPGAFNDVDLCMKVTWLGNEIYWTPHAELFHFESKTRDASVHEFEIDVAWGRWGFRMHDPRYWPYPHDRRPMNAGDLAW